MRSSRLGSIVHTLRGSSAFGKLNLPSSGAFLPQKLSVGRRGIFTQLQPLSFPPRQLCIHRSEHSNQQSRNRPVPSAVAQVKCFRDRCFPGVSSRSFMLKVTVPERILIVDDAPEARASLEAHLHQRGYEVLTAGSGLDAQAILARQKIACMIVEARLFGSGGGDFLSR